MAVIRHKEAIHSGQFMVSEFEADEEDIEDIPEVVGDISNVNKDEGIGKLSKSSGGPEFIAPQSIANRHDPTWHGFAAASPGQIPRPAPQMLRHNDDDHIQDLKCR